jgi:outer membrane lipoprotein-sorting protein
MSNKILRGLILALILAPVTLVAQTSRGTMSLDAVIQQASAQQKRIETLQADFRQEKSMALLAQPEVSSGRFVYSKPHDVIWKYATPNQVVMLISQGWLTTYYPHLNKAEKIEVSRYQDRIFRYMAATGAVDELSKYFNFKFVETRRGTRSFTLELTPKTRTLSRRVQRIKLWIDPETFLTTRVEYVEGDGDLTIYEFSNIRLNEKVSPATFELNLPNSVKIDQIRLN